ncbi:uncharacterized protein LOC117424390 isoform X1 [Acipenser ruthenus]|uniref:uncharacterized protein LOC117424390 isoform X1 n=1 Tax=Acipenser ruthenus TaxID=7906 RepID=UPI0027403AB4|nr:uncharacterized protein LOC117424390 isoform X1 [Acipenser ruthenus]
MTCFIPRVRPLVFPCQASCRMSLLEFRRFGSIWKCTGLSRKGPGCSRCRESISQSRLADMPLGAAQALLASASMMIDMALLARHQNLLLQGITPFPHLSSTMSIVHYQLRQLQEAGTSTRGSARPIHLATCYKCGEKGHYANKCGRRHLGLLAGH